MGEMIDWNAVWKDLRAQGGTRGSRVCLDKWRDLERCRKYDQWVKEDNWRRSRETIAKLEITPASRVLDIGAGPGTLAIPLAQTVERVTAVEPSSAMLECLNENIRATGLANIKPVPKLWDDIDLHHDLELPYDVVIASYSLGMSDLAEALTKMNEATSKYAYIYWFADPSPWERNYAELWEELHGMAFTRKGKADIIFNLLYQMGIYANVDIYPEESEFRYSGIEEAVADQRYGFNVTSEAQEAILRKFLIRKLQAEDGQYVLRGVSHRAGIWWRKETGG